MAGFFFFFKTLVIVGYGIVKTAHKLTQSMHNGRYTVRV